MNKFLSKKILAISFFVISISLSSCSSSFSKEGKFIPASQEEINLYRQIYVNYLCLARQAKVEFPRAHAIASNNFASIVLKKHGGLVGLDANKLTKEQLFQGSALQLIESAIQLCPDSVPEEEKKKFLKFIEQSKSIDKSNKKD